VIHPEPPTAPATRPPVTRESIVAAALELLAEGGLDGVSFRRIAGKLGVSAPTLYWHVDNKRQLMDLMAEALIQRTGSGSGGPRSGQPWWDWLRTDARQMFAALISTRDAPRVVAGNRPSPESFAGIERTLGVLVEAGLTPGQAQQTLFAIGAYVIGSATEWQAEAERQGSQPLPDRDDDARDLLAAGPLADHPMLLAAIGELLDTPDTSAFEYGLDLLVDALRTRHAPPS
jgi:TetR/AcrR family tetracycline transcriptional repressor